MKAFFLSGAFWGVLLIIIGVLAILRAVFNISIPIFRIAFALVLIYIGISVLAGGFSWSSHGNMVLFDDRRISVTEADGEYNIIFGKGTIDLSKLSPENARQIETNVIFADGQLLIDPEVPAKIVLHSAFAQARTPDGVSVALGEHVYKTGPYQERERHLNIEASVVFGVLDVVEKQLRP